ncbi:MAG: hypothetical protein A2033_13515 [Bacteroidetes bacterium GWA2_31_9]|nr:MAG: hypothetical protein A2033_13515 [Bacteroidetes bacterium GWA2_31_9]
MKKLVLLTSILLVILINFGFSQCDILAKKYGGINDENLYKQEKDSVGNIYICGTFMGTTIFGADTLISFGDKDIFFAKLDTLGNVLWVNKAGGSFGDQIYDFVIDNNSFIYITGSFNTNATFGTTNLTSFGANDIYIAKYNIDGNFIWAKGAGSTTDDFGSSIDIYNNEIYLTGNSQSNSNFSSLILQYPSTFFAKYDLNGNIIYVQNAFNMYKSISSPKIKINSNGELYLTGNCSYNITIGNDTIPIIGSTDVLLVKYDNTFNYLWGISAGGSSSEAVKSILIDENNDIYLCGSFQGTASFAGTILNSYGNSTAFLVKFNSSGNIIWANRAGGTGFSYYGDVFNSLKIDNLNNIIVNGNFTNGIHNFGTSSYNVNTEGGVYVKYNQNGNFLSYYSEVGSCFFEQNNKFYDIGTFSWTKNIGMTSILSTGGLDIHFIKFSNFSEFETYTPSICMVTVNSYNNCRIAWEEPATTRIANYKVFKKDVIGDYNLISTVPYGTGYFVDNTSNPVQKTQNYKLSLSDVCGNETNLSYSHETMHLVIFQNPDDDWSLMWSEYLGVSYEYYRIYRGTTPTTMVLIDSIAGGNEYVSYTDINAPTGYVYYQIEVATDITCSLAKSTTSLRSNIAYYGPAPGSTSIVENDFSQNVSVFPNPNNGKFYISLNGFYEKNTIVKIYDYKGSLIDERSFEDNSNKNFNQFDISNYSSGIYVVKVITNNNAYVEKIIKNL